MTETYSASRLIEEASEEQNLEEHKPKKQLRDIVLENNAYIQKKLKEEEDKKNKKFKWGWRNERAFKQANSKQHSNETLVFYLNQNYGLEGPKYMNIMPGQIIVWKNKSHKYDPSSLWVMQDVKNKPKIYLIREIDKLPVSNKDNEQLMQDGRSTHADEILLKQLLQAGLIQSQSKKNLVAIGIAIVVIVGLAIWLLSSGNGTAVASTVAGAK